MKKYIIRWNAGYGDSVMVVEASSDSHAENIAYHNCKDEAEDNADYECIGEATIELLEEHNLNEV